MIVFELTGAYKIRNKQSVETFYLRTSEELLEVLHTLLMQGSSIGIRKIEVSETEYNKISFFNNTI